MGEPVRAAGENSTPAANARKVVGRPFQPGKSGNPGGRPKGLAARIREQVPAEKLTEHYRAIFELDSDALERLQIAPSDVTLAERNKAGEWLADRGYGKAPIHAPVEGADPLERDAVDRALDEVMDELAPRREATATGEGEGRAVEAESQARTATA